MAKSWKYQKGRYKQISLKFNMDNDSDVVVYEYLSNCRNISQTIRTALLDVIAREQDVNGCYGCMGSAFGDCETCKKGV